MTNETDAIARALALPNGARYYKCALQVNPFAYLKRHNKQTPFQDEAAYDRAMVEACQQNGVEVIAVTDHYRIRESESLQKAARGAGIHVFPGFEAVTKEGVHVLCVFDPQVDAQALDRAIGYCGVCDESETSPTGDRDFGDLLAAARTKWGAVCIAAHVTAPGGLLCALKGQARAERWRNDDLLAVSIPGTAAAAPQAFRQILANDDLEYHRSRPVALLNAQDVNGPEDLARPAGTWCWIKMADVSVEGLRQAFLDPASRIRLAADPQPEAHAELVAMAWQGGFLDGEAIHFNENLNVLVGGRGAGKSTVIESLRHVLGLEPLGDEARRAYDGIVRHVLKSGTKISLRVRSHRPSKRDYLIERTIPNPATVRDVEGGLLALSPADLLPNVELFGQHEISELTKSEEKLTRLLDRFVEVDAGLQQRKAEVRRELERSRARVVEARQELARAAEQLAALPGLEETLKRFREAGIEERLREQSLLVREERVLQTAGERLAPFREMLERLRRALPLDRAFLSDKALEGLPGKEILAKAQPVLERLDGELSAIAEQLSEAVRLSGEGLGAVRGEWEARRAQVQAAYEHVLRELQKTRVDGDEFIRLRRRIEDLGPIKEREAALRRAATEHEAHREQLIAEWEDMKAAEFRQLERAARKVTERLNGRVRVEVSFAGNREPLFRLLREHVGGRLQEAVDALGAMPALSLPELARAWRQGRETLSTKFGMPQAQAERMVQAGPDVVMHLEELDLAPTTRIELNVAAAQEPPEWRALEDLSTGQKATAILLLLLLESDAPLVVDQPEDDLDNRFVTEGVVPRMREEKRRRQFVFSTHNANIPVLGDAELILGLSAAGEPGERDGHGRIAPEHVGSIDTGSVKALVAEVLEGGRAAFETRRAKYGF